MKNKFLKFFIAASFVTFSACETLELDQVVDPNAPNADLLDVNFAFNNIQLSLRGFVNANNGFTQRMTRQLAMTGGPTYNNAFQAVSFNGIWGSGYGLLQNISQMETKAESAGLNYQLGAAKVIKSYVWTSLADVFGDIPYSEALQGNTNLAPSFDNSAEVYAGALAELNEAIVLLSQPALSYPVDDFYYSNAGVVNAASQAKWLTAAKTFKLRLLNNARLNGAALGVDIAAEMTSLLNENDLIDTEAEDFAFKYGNNRAVPNTRHPSYNLMYENATAIGGTYLGNYMMWTVVREKAVPDPRRTFYFFRQDTNTVGETIFTLGCAFQTAPSHYGGAQYASFYQPAVLTPFCVTLTSGYWGRDHGDATGLPPDNAKRSVVGVYPAGGKWDENVQASVQNNGTDGFLGQGIMPILMSSWVNFIKAEAILALGVPGDAKAELEAGIKASINKAVNFLPSSGYVTLITNQQTALVTAANPNATPEDLTVLINNAVNAAVTNFNNSIDNYVNYVLNVYDTATAAQKLEIVIKEYYIASWGNGLEPYNSYRRTGYPSNFQPTLNPSPGDYFSTALYPSDSVINNPNAPANTRTNKVFWDTANITLH